MASGHMPPEPAEYTALAALAQREWRAGRLVEAAAAYRQIVALRPDSAEAHNHLANTLYRQNNLEEATVEYERALALNPNLSQAHNNLGNILRQQGRFVDALARFQQAIALTPDRAEPYNNLGNLLLSLDRHEEAAIQFQRALTLRPDLAEPYNNLGNVLKEAGRLDEAATRYKQAIALRPDYAEPHVNLGNIHFSTGEFAKASIHFRQALALKPDAAEAYFHLSELKTFQPGDLDLAALQALAADAQRLPPSERLFVYFALAKALEDIGDYEGAFAHWLAGNALKRGGMAYDETASLGKLERIAQTFDGNLLQRFAGAGHPSPAPIFIVGMPRSGSTLIEQILSRHPQVYAAGELSNLDRVARSVTDQAGRSLAYPTYVPALDAVALRRMGQAYLASLPAPPADKTRITDKLPGNFLYIGLIRLILPGARIIHTVRDPVDTCVSCFSRVFKFGQPFTYELAELGRYYCGYERMMAHWRGVLPPGAMLEIAYEQVVENLEEQARRLIDYCGLPWDERCLSFHQSDRRVQTSSNVQVRRPLYRSSIARWRRYEAWLQPLLSELARCPRGE